MRSVRLDPETGGSRWWVWLAGGAGLLVAALLVVAIGIGEWRPKRIGRADGAVSQAVRLALRAMGTDPDEVAILRGQLLTAFEGRRDRMPAPAAASVRESVALLDAQIEEIARALEKNPDDRRLARMLAEAYRQELEMLRRVSDAPGMGASPAPPEAVAPDAG